VAFGVPLCAGRDTKRAALVAITNAESTPHKEIQEVVELKREEHSLEALGEGFTRQAKTQVVQEADKVLIRCRQSIPELRTKSTVVARIQPRRMAKKWGLALKR
jgi:hypothetical protein